MNSKVLFNELVKAITLDESGDEIHTITYIILENAIGVSRTDVFTERNINFNAADDQAIKNIITRINNHEPVQYIFGETEFYGRKFRVNSSVLIPRPETEELVAHVKDHFSEKNITGPQILDIGTGSGCIAVSLALEIPGARVFGTDVSLEALEVARHNVMALEARVTLFANNILRDDIQIAPLDGVVSNPPYIPMSEKLAMKNNVTRFEPALALFVSDEDPMLFYRVIASKAFNSLTAGGLLALEINERFGLEVAKILTSAGFTSVGIVKDLFRKERIVKGLRP